MGAYVGALAALATDGAIVCEASTTSNEVMNFMLQ